MAGSTQNASWLSSSLAELSYKQIWHTSPISSALNTKYVMFPNTKQKNIVISSFLWFNVWLKIPLPITYLKGACLEQELFHLHHLSLRVIYEQPRWDTAHMQQLVCHHDAGVLTLWRKLIAISVLWPPHAHTPLRDVVMRRVSPNAVREAAERRVWMDL